jgi:hypothetical protein
MGRMFSESIATIVSEQAVAEATTRLQASREEWEKEQERKQLEAGFDAGVRWGEKKAQYAELRNLQQLRESLDDEMGDGFDQYFDECDDCCYQVSELVGSVIVDGYEADVDRKEAWDFWKSIGSEGNPSGPWLKGFVLGATELLEVVEE